MTVVAVKHQANVKHRRSHGYAPAALYGGLLCVLLIVLQGCGFYPVGAVQLPDRLERTFIDGDPYDELVVELGRSLRAAGAEVVDVETDASGVVRVLSQRFSRRTLSVGRDGKVREYELHYRVRLQIGDSQGRDLTPIQTFDLVRDYLNDETDVLGKSQEESLLRTEMRREAARRILRRLETLG